MIKTFFKDPLIVSEGQFTCREPTRKKSFRRRTDNEDISLDAQFLCLLFCFTTTVRAKDELKSVHINIAKLRAFRIDRACGNKGKINIAHICKRTAQRQLMVIHKV